MAVFDEVFAALEASQETQKEAGAYLHALVSILGRPLADLPKMVEYYLAFIASAQLRNGEIMMEKAIQHMPVKITREVFVLHLVTVDTLLVEAARASRNKLDEGDFSYTPLPVYSPPCEHCEAADKPCWIRQNQAAKWRKSKKCETCFARKIPCIKQGGDFSSGKSNRKISTTRRNADDQRDKKEDTAATLKTLTGIQGPGAVSSSAPAGSSWSEPVGGLMYPSTPPSSPVMASKVEPSPRKLNSRLIQSKTLPVGSTVIPASKEGMRVQSGAKRVHPPSSDSEPRKKARVEVDLTATSLANSTQAASRPQLVATTNPPNHNPSLVSSSPDAEQQYVQLAHEKALEIIAHIGKNGCDYLPLKVAVEDMEASFDALGVCERIDCRASPLSPDVLNRTREVLCCAGEDVEKAEKSLGIGDIRLKTLLVAFSRRLADLRKEY